MKQEVSPSKEIVDAFFSYLGRSALKISAVISFLTVLFNFVSLLQGNLRIPLLTSLILIIIVFSTAWLFLLHVYRKKVGVTNEHIYLDDPQVIFKHKYPRKVRLLALNGLIALPFIFSFLGWIMIKSFSSRETIILITELGGDSNAGSRLSKSIQGGVLLLTQQRRYLKIKTIRSIEGNAGDLMQEYNASIMLGGLCTLSPQGKLTGTIDFYSATPIATFSIPLGGYSQSSSTGEDSTFERLTDEMICYIAFAIGRKLYVERDFDEAISFFSVAEGKIKSIEPGAGKPNASDVYYYRGLAHLENSTKSAVEYDLALNDFTEAIRNGRERDADVYYRRGLSYLNLAVSGSDSNAEQLKCAIAEFQKAHYLNNNNKEYHGRCQTAYSTLQKLSEFRNLNISDVPRCPSEVDHYWIAQQVCREHDVRWYLASR